MEESKELLDVKTLQELLAKRKLQYLLSINKYRSLGRAIRRKHITEYGTMLYKRPFNNRRNTSIRKNIHSRRNNQIRKALYGIR